MSYSYRAAGTSGLPTQADLKHWNPASPSANSPFGQPSLEDWAAFLEASRPMDDLAGSTIDVPLPWQEMASVLPSMAPPDLQGGLHSAGGRLTASPLKMPPHLQHLVGDSVASPAAGEQAPVGHSDPNSSAGSSDNSPSAFDSVSSRSGMLSGISVPPTLAGSGSSSRPSSIQEHQPGSGAVFPYASISSSSALGGGPLPAYPYPIVEQSSESHNHLMLPPTSTSMSLPSGAGGMDGSNWLLMGSPDRPRLSVPSDAFAALSTHEPPSEEWLLPPEDPQTSYNPTARFRSRAVSSLQDVSSVGFSRLGPHPPSLADVHTNGAGPGSGTVGSNSGGSVYHAHLASLLSGPHPLAVDGDADATADIHQSSPNSLVPPAWHMNDELEEQRRHSLPAHLHASHESDLHHHHPLISPPLGGIQSGGGGGAHASAYHFLPRASIPLHLSAFNAANTSLSHHSPSSSSSPPTSTDLLSLFSKPAWANTVAAPMLSHRHSSLSNTSTSREGSSRGRRKNGSYSGRASLGSAMGSSSTLAAASLGSSSAHSHLSSIMPSSLMHAKRKAQLAASVSAPLGSSEFGEFLDGSNTSATSLSASSGSNGKAAKIFDCPHCIRTFTRRHDAERHARIHSGETPYKCTRTGCTREFRRSDALLRHQQWHAAVEAGTIPGASNEGGGTGGATGLPGDEPLQEEPM